MAVGRPPKIELDENEVRGFWAYFKARCELGLNPTEAAAYVRDLREKGLL